MSHDWLGTGKPRGYAFIEYEHKNNMKEAYKRADGKKVEGKRVVVDVERGRTVHNWYVSDLCVRMSPLSCGRPMSLNCCASQEQLASCMWHFRLLLLLSNAAVSTYTEAFLVFMNWYVPQWCLSCTFTT